MDRAHNPAMCPPPSVPSPQTGIGSSMMALERRTTRAIGRCENSDEMGTDMKHATAYSGDGGAKQEGVYERVCEGKRFALVARDSGPAGGFVSASKKAQSEKPAKAVAYGVRPLAGGEGRGRASSQHDPVKVETMIALTNP